jgi:hypothetical protein
MAAIKMVLSDQHEIAVSINQTGPMGYKDGRDPGGLSESVTVVCWNAGRQACGDARASVGDLQVQGVWWFQKAWTAGRSVRG